MNTPQKFQTYLPCDKQAHRAPKHLLLGEKRMLVSGGAERKGAGMEAKEPRATGRVGTGFGEANAEGKCADEGELEAGA